MAYPPINRAKFIDIPSLVIMFLAVAIPAHPNSAGAASQYRSVMKHLAR